MITYFVKNKKRGKKSKVFWPGFLVFVLILLGLIIFLGVSNWKVREKRITLENQFQILNQKIEKLEEETQKLRERSSLFKKKEYLEKVAREIFNLKKPGEKVIVIKRENFLALEPEKEEKEVSILEQWLNWIKKKL